MKIHIKKSPTADTRTCDWRKVTKPQLYNSSVDHIMDVRLATSFLASRMYDQAENHDADKITDIDGFHHDFKTGFKETTWWENHKKVNRHHLKEPDGIPKDVNLLDVLEYITDCVTAGLARSGKVTDVTIDPEVLMNAFDNTIKLLIDNAEISDE